MSVTTYHLFRRLLTVVLIFPVLACATPKPLIFSHVVSENTPKGKMAKMFKSMIEDKYSDKYEIVIYSDSSLMNDEEAVDAIAEGRIHFAAPSLSKFDAYTQKLKVFDLPFLFPDMEAVNRFQESATGQELLASMASSGVLGLGYLHNGLKQLTATKPFVTPSDLAGLRFRIMNSDVLRKQFEIINVVPVPMAFSDVYQALANNEIQGQENTWSNIFSKALYEHQGYMMESNHGVLDYMLITNTDFWGSLSEEETRYFKYSLSMALQYGNAVGIAKSTNDRDELRRMKGLQILRPTKEELAVWQTAMRPLWEEYEPLIGRPVLQAATKAASGL